jgi:lipopolysaccharide transport system permease protein
MRENSSNDLSPPYLMFMLRSFSVVPLIKVNYLQTLSLSHTMASFKLKSEASRLILSYLWWVIEPLLYVGVFYLVFDKLLQRGGEDFLTFLIVGKIPFLWFSKSVNGSANALLAGKGLMGQRNFPKHIFPYAIVQENAYKQWAVFLLLFILVLLQGYNITESWFWLPVVIFTNLLLILPISMLASLIVAHIPDFRLLIQLGTLFLMFASGIFFDIHKIADPAIRQLVFDYNPLAFLLDAYRQILMYQSRPDLAHLAVIAGISILLLVFMHWIFKLQSQIIAKKVLS